MENIKKLYKYTGKCDDQHQYKHFLEEAMVFIPDEITENIPLDVRMFDTLKKSSARKSLIQFLTQKKFSADWELIKKRAKPSKYAVVYGLLFKSEGDIKNQC